MQAFGKTDKGVVRETNQDSFACGVFEDGAAWAVVCDGMGGANGGDVASSCAVERIKTILLERYNTKLNEKQIGQLFSDAADAANAEIAEKAAAEPELQGMGTTLVAAIVRKGSAYIAHAGDSRAYIIDGSIKQVTKDHSVVQEMVDRGQLTKERAECHPYKNIITRALGVGKSIKTDFAKHKMGRKARLLICSDGLSNFVPDVELLKMAESVEAEALPEAYISAANNAGGRDNITAVIISE